VEDKAISQNGKERGEAFNGVDEGNGYFLCGGGREDVAADLEESEGKSGCYNVSTGVANAMFECWDGGLKWRKDVGEVSEENAPGGYKGELD